MTTVSPGLEAAPAAKPATPSPPQPPRARPSPLVRWLLRVPPALYRLGLARQAGKRFLLLTTSGRKTGRRYTCALSYVRTAAAIYVFAGWGPRSDWYRNALADPDVSVQLGTDLWQAMAHPIDDPDERARLLRRMAEGADAQGPPRPVRRLLRLFGFDYDAEVRRSLERRGNVPVLALVPPTPGGASGAGPTRTPLTPTRAA